MGRGKKELFLIIQKYSKSDQNWNDKYPGVPWREVDTISSECLPQAGKLRVAGSNQDADQRTWLRPSHTTF